MTKAPDVATLVRATRSCPLRSQSDRIIAPPRNDAMCHKPKSGFPPWTTNYWTRGSLTLNDAPPWSRFLAHICPLCASIMVRAMDNPMPMPSALLV